ncbi:hypothetical protein LINGRAHAP2_LOCUS8764 [Linum grandiflorum]
MSRWEPIGLSKHGKVICIDKKQKKLQMLDVATGQTSAPPLELGEDELRRDAVSTQLAIYVPSKKSLSPQQVTV